MMRNFRLVILLALFALFLFAASGCDDAAEDAAEDSLEEVTGFPWDIGCNEDAEVENPKDWGCMFAVNLDDTQAEMLDGSFEVDISLIEKLVDLDTEYQIVFAKIEEVEGSTQLRFANKIKIEDGKLMLDGESTEKLGDSVGSAGAGWYGAFFASKAFGFINGDVVNCNGAKEDGILVTASDGPFFTYSAANGSWAVPSLGGKPATVYFSDGDDCSGNSSDPVTDEDNPKDEETGEDTTPNMDEFSDDTDNVDAGEDEMDPVDPNTSTDNMYDFEDGTLQGFAATGACADVGDAGYGTFFPDGAEANYMWMSTGGDHFQSCTVTKTMVVPDGVTELVISYDFASQEYPEYVGSAYNDIFTAIIQGEYDYIVNRAVNSIALDNDWADLSGDAATAANVTTSADAGYNSTGQKYDGHLKWGTSEDTTPRGDAADDMAGTVARYPVESGATITLLLTVSDVADAYWDTVAVIDYITFQ